MTRREDHHSHTEADAAYFAAHYGAENHIDNGPLPSEYDEPDPIRTRPTGQPEQAAAAREAARLADRLWAEYQAEQNDWEASA